MDYNMMPPPPNSTSNVTSDNFGGGGHFSDTSQNTIYNEDSIHQPSANSSEYNSQYKPHFSGRAHVNRPPPLSLNQTFYQDSISQSAPGSLTHYHDHQSPHCVQSPRLAASPHPNQSTLVTHSSHIDQSPRPAPHLLHRQSSAQHLVHSPLHQNFQNPSEIAQSPRSTPGHMQQSMFPDPNPNQLPNTPYEQISSPLRRKHRHYSDSTRSPHPYNPPPIHHFNNVAPSPHHYNDPNPSPHYFNDPTPSPHHFNDPTQQTHHFNDPTPSPHHFQEANNTHRPAYLESSQPGTPVGYVNSHPGTPAGYVNSPHHASPHPSRSNHQHFFGPNVLIPPVNGGNLRAENSTCEIQNTSQFNQQTTDSSQHQAGSNVLLHSSAGGHGDAMLSAININQQDRDNVLQDASSGITESAMETDWHSTVSHNVKQSNPNSNVTSYANLFESGANPPDVDELLSQATDFIANTNNLSLSDVNAAKDATKSVKSRPKGRPTKMSPRAYGAQCPVCSKTFNNSSALAKHKLTHSDERKYVCSLCAKAFKRQDHLNGHMMTHRTKKPFECTFEGCTKSYCDARSLRRHLENHHNVPPETLYDMSLPNYGINNGGSNIYSSFHGDATSPSPHASPGYQTSQGQYFRFDSGHSGNESGDNPNFLINSDSGPAPAECSVCHKRFKNLPALNGHMRLHGGYASVKKPDTGRSSDSKSSKSDSLSSDAASVKFNMSDRQTGSERASVYQERDPPHSNTQFSMNQNTAINSNNATFTNNQGNVRQDGGRLAAMSAATYLSNVAGTAALQGQSSSEPSFQQNFVNHMPFSTLDQQMLLQVQRQIQGGRQMFPTLPMIPLSTASEPFLFHVSQPRQRGDVDYLNQGLVVSSSSLEHKLTDRGQNESSLMGRVKPNNDALSHHSDDREIDQEVSQINSSRQSTDHEKFLAERKRHASAPEKLSEDWNTKDQDQQQQLNERLARAQNSQRRRRSSADNHHNEFKHPHHTSSRLRSGDIFTQSDGAMIFRSPPPGGLKRRKNRPEPLVIPPNVAAVQSRLRSPRIWEPGEMHGQRHTGKTPPPYTPPPILSPMRSGTGLFYGISSYRPPQVILSASLPATKITSQLKQQDPIVEEPEPVVVKTEEKPASPESDVEAPQAPETDILPHINVGPNHQAALPTCRKSFKDAHKTPERATLLWSPDCLHSITSEEMNAYMDFSCSAAVPGSGSNKEYALHQLFFNKGDLPKSLLALMSKSVHPDFVKFIGDYHYQDSDVWTTEDIEVYTEAIMKDDKDFISITETFNDRKTHRQCVEFYYLWKKICPDEYKRLRIIRRKRKNDELYNLRSRGDKQDDGSGAANSDVGDDEEEEDDLESISQLSEAEADDEEVGSDVQSSTTTSVLPPTLPHHQPSAFTCDYPECMAVFHSKQALNGHIRIHVPQRSAPAPPERVRDSSPATSAPTPPKKIKSEPIPAGTEEFPCKLCGKVFYKVKSRSAHMKSHSVLAKKQREAAAQARHPS